MSYRQYCAWMVNRLENKTVRAFVHLPVHQKVRIYHSQLSQLRNDLTRSPMINLMVYVTHLLIKEVKIPPNLRGRLQ
jgi:hypothetical protein